MKLYCGHTIYDGIRTNYIVDSKDMLDPELRGYYETDWIKENSWIKFMAMVSEQEKKGIRYLISIKDMYYETPEDVE